MQNGYLLFRFLFVFFLIAQLSSAQSSSNYSNDFLNIGVDAASLGMSKAVVASSADVNSTYWNPAGLTNVKDYQASLMHASYFESITNYDFLGFAMPVDESSAFGFSIIRFGVDDILNTTTLIEDGGINYDNIDLFSTVDYAFNISYSRKIKELKGLSLGLNTKIIRRIIGDFANSWGFGFDVGLQYQRKGFLYGVIIRDVTTTFNTWSFNEAEFEKISDAISGENNELPENNEFTIPSVQAGVAKSFELSKTIDLLAEANLFMRFQQSNDLISNSFVSIDPALGLQADYKKIAFLRLGAGNFQRETESNGSKNLTFQPNFGVGFYHKGIQVDYALTNIGRAGSALYSNVFSLKFDFSEWR